MNPYRISRYYSFLALALLVFAVGCDDVYLSNPLDAIRDDQIAGRWAGEDGKLSLIIQRGSGSSYDSWGPDDYTAHKPPTVFYIAETGGMLFVEQQSDCSGHKFQAPDPKETPKGCWAITRVVLSDTTLDYYNLDAMTIVKRSLAGVIGIAHSYGVTASKNDKAPSAEVLLKGSSGELSSFLATFAQGAIYSQPKKLHRV